LVYHSQGDRKRAMESYRTAMKVQPRDVRPVVNLGILLSEAGKPDLAERLLKKALQIAPQDLKALEQLAELQEKARDLDAAAASLRDAIRAHPREAGVRVHLGRLLAKMGGQERNGVLFKERAEQLEAAFGLAPQDEKELQNAGFDTAEELGDDGSEEDPDEEEGEGEEGDPEDDPEGAEGADEEEVEEMEDGGDFELDDEEDVDTEGEEGEDEGIPSSLHRDEPQGLYDDGDEVSDDLYGSFEESFEERLDADEGEDFEEEVAFDADAEAEPNTDDSAKGRPSASVRSEL